jgi:hypothetical protein
MIAARRTAIAALACAMAAALPARADTTTYEDVNGLRYQVTRGTRQMPVTQNTPQTQTVYRQQVTTQTLQQQQLYTVPVTQYQLVSRLHGRWNPFITPYWTHNYEPVTTWQQQTATVQIPVNTVAWVPETRSVQTPSTTYKTVEQLVMTPIVSGTNATGSQQMMASSGTATTSPSATLVARAPGSASPAANATPLSSVPSVASAPTTYGAAGVGGTQLNSDPPRQPTGSAWQTPSPSSYR